MGGSNTTEYILLIDVIAPLLYWIITFYLRLCLGKLSASSGSLFLACLLTLRSHSRHKSCTRNPGHAVGRHSIKMMQRTYSKSVCHIECNVRRSSRPLRVQKQRHSFHMTESTFSLFGSGLRKSEFVVTSSGSSNTNPSTWICLRKEGMEHWALKWTARNLIAY